MEMIGNADFWVNIGITIFLVVVVNLFFRASDKSQSTVKNFFKRAEGANRKLDKKVEETEQKITDLLSLLETEEETLKGLYDDFKRRHGEVEACRKAINTVADATKNADANLAILEEKGRIVTSLREELENVKRDRVTILEDLNRSNQSAVEALGVKVLNNVELKLNSIRDDLERAEERYAGFNEKTEKLRDDVVSDIEKIAAEHKAELNLLKESSKSAEEGLFADLDKESRQRLENLKNDVFAQIAAYQDTIGGRLAALDQLIAQSEKLEETFSGLKGEIDTLRETAASDISGKISVFSEEFIRGFGDKYEKLSAEYREKLGSLSSTIEAQAALIEGTGKMLEELRELRPVTEKQLEELSSRMAWIARTETGLMDQNKRAEENISLLGGLTGNKPVSSAGPERNINETESHIKKLIDLGWDNRQIADKLGISESEVAFIREF